MSKEDNIIFSDLPSKETKKALIGILNRLEPFGLFRVNCLRKEKSFQFSTSIISSYIPGFIQEFGSEIDPSIKEKYALRMTEDLTYALLKVQILKESFVYRNECFMVRIKNKENRYPKYHVKKSLKLWKCPKNAEIVFFADSKEGEVQIKNFLKEALCKPIQYFVDENLALMCDCLRGQLLNDPDIKPILRLAAYMTKGLLKQTDLETITTKKEKNDN